MIIEFRLKPNPDQRSCRANLTICRSRVSWAASLAHLQTHHLRSHLCHYLAAAAAQMRSPFGR